MQNNTFDLGVYHLRVLISMSQTTACASHPTAERERKRERVGEASSLIKGSFSSTIGRYSHTVEEFT